MLRVDWLHAVYRNWGLFADVMASSPEIGGLVDNRNCLTLILSNLTVRDSRGSVFLYVENYFSNVATDVPRQVSGICYSICAPAVISPPIGTNRVPSPTNSCRAATKPNWVG